MPTLVTRITSETASCVRSQATQNAIYPPAGLRSGLCRFELWYIHHHAATHERGVLSMPLLLLRAGCSDDVGQWRVKSISGPTCEAKNPFINCRDNKSGPYRSALSCGNASSDTGLWAGAACGTRLGFTKEPGCSSMEERKRAVRQGETCRVRAASSQPRSHSRSRVYTQHTSGFGLLTCLTYTLGSAPLMPGSPLRFDS